MDYARKSLRCLQILENNAGVQIKTARKLARLVTSDKHKKLLAGLLVDLLQTRTELGYWVRQKGGITR